LQLRIALINAFPGIYVPALPPKEYMADNLIIKER
jgi:hypothetical protein